MTGDELREKRQIRGLSQRDIAVELGVHESTVCRWESGQIQIKGLSESALALMFEKMNASGVDVKAP